MRQNSRQNTVFQVETPAPAPRWSGGAGGTRVEETVQSRPLSG